MKSGTVIIIAFCIIAVFILCMSIFGGCAAIKPDEFAFRYNIMSGKPVSPQDNPMLPVGFNFKWGIHSKFFRVSSQAHQFTFCVSVIEESPYNEEVTSDSMEGTTMAVDYTIKARVTDVWKFYENYGINQYGVPKEAKTIKDPRVYEAIREAGGFVNVALPEINQATPAAEIRKNTVFLNQELTRKTQEYMEQFGIKVEEVILGGNFRYKGDQAGVQEATNKLGDKNSEVERKQREKSNAESQRINDVEQAKIEADNTIAAADREGERLLSEAKAIVAEMKASVDQVGKDNTVVLFVSRELSELVRKGKIPQSFISEGSLTGTGSVK